MIAARLMWYITIASAIVGLFNDVVRAGAGASILHRLQLAIVFRDVSRLASEMAPRWHRVHCMPLLWHRVPRHQVLAWNVGSLACCSVIEQVD